MASLVRQLQTERGIHERTGWRWIARMKATGQPIPLEGRPCAECGEALPKGARIDCLYCSGRCRVKVFRARVRSSEQA